MKQKKNETRTCRPVVQGQNRTIASFYAVFDRRGQTLLSKYLGKRQKRQRQNVLRQGKEVSKERNQEAGGQQGEESRCRWIQNATDMKIRT